MTVGAAAAEAFRSRQHTATERLAAGRVTEEAANRHLRPWAAIACLCGVYLPEFQHDFDSIVTIAGREPTEAERRAMVADDLCPAAEWRATLARAYGKAPGNADLHALCRHFGVTPIMPQEVAP